jgi:PAS domain S-box-containing protein
MHRLTGVYARRNLRIAATLVIVPPALSLGIHLTTGGATPLIVLTTMSLAALIIIRLLAEIVPRRGLAALGGAIGFLGVMTSAVSLGYAGPGAIAYPAGFVGLIPACVVVLALWDLRAHLAWLALTSVALLAAVLAQSGTEPMASARWTILAGWLLGSSVSIAGQVALDRGRIANYRAAQRAHASRRDAARALRRLQAVESIGRALSERGPADETLEAAMHLLADDFGYTFPSIYLGDDQLLHLRAQLGLETPVLTVPRARGVMGRVMRTKQPVLLPDVTTDPDFVRASDAVTSEIVVPLLAGDRFLGILNVESRSALGSDDLASLSIVADRFAAAIALADRRATLQSVLDASPLGMASYGANGNVTYWNPRAADLLGWTADQVVGGRAPIVEPDDPATLAIAERVDRGERVYGVEAERRHRDGHLVPVRIFAAPFGDRPPYGTIALYQDITAERLAERRVRSVLEQASNPIVGVDPDGIITFANARIRDLLGYTPAEVIGQPVELLVADEAVDAHQGHRSAYLEHPSPRPMGIGRDLLARHRDGSMVPVEIAINPVETPTGLEVYATIVDTTERRRIEAELLQAAKMDSIGRLAGGIAHDFNNLLTAIIGYGRLATGSLPGDEPARADVEAMVLAAERAAALTRQLLGFARKTVLDPATHDLNAIVEALEPFLRRLLGERVALVKHLGAATGHIRVDRSQIDQILVNLAVNARDAMPDGGTLVIETSVHDAADVDGILDLRGERIALLAVSDTGVGMTASVRARAFEPFFTTKPFGQGTGLGLATTYGIVRQSGGAITVDSSPGAGSTFRIYFPQVDPVDVAADDVPAVVTAATPARTVLVVEDEESVRALVARMLERAGYRVLQAPNGAAAVSLVGTRLSEIDLLLTDVVMPGMRGPELYDVLCQARPDLPVLFMSGYAEGHDGAGAIPAGTALLTKPFALDALVAAVAERVAHS